MGKIIKFIFVTVIITIIMIGIVGYLFYGKKDSGIYSGPVEKIIIANQRENSIFNYIAKEQGYFKENGLDVDIKEYESGAPASEDLLAGKVDVAIVGEFVGVIRIFNNNQVRIVAQLSKQQYVRLVARKDSGISTPADLKGKRIGITKGTASEIFASKFLLFNGLSFSDVSIINLSPPQMIDQITTGEIDAVVSFEPTPYIIEKKLGANAISWSAQGFGDTYAILISTDNYIKSHSQVVERYVKSLVQAEKYLNDNSNQAKNILSKFTNYDGPYISYFWPKINFYLALEQQFILTLEDEARWAIVNKLTDALNVPNYLNYIYIDALKNVKPGGINLIQQ